ncbi:uncharacterized protein LOC129720424 [Wyeomyia smithii]|uniref:uncharacterized protein LOC129720424 n=1 Tax=Wyeomyia smithii TaxID=174621 RepID=UPI002467E6EC|nr:uncharacterized protein LOC129720424 [Wyeomyia smithii]
MAEFKRIGIDPDKITNMSGYVQQFRAVHWHTEKDTFYAQLERKYDRCPKHVIKIIIGDYNVQVSQEKEFKPVTNNRSAPADQQNVRNGNGNDTVDATEDRDVPLTTIGKDKDAIKRLRNNKSAGKNDVGAELIKMGQDTTIFGGVQDAVWLAGEPSISKVVNTRRIRWAGHHVARMSDNYIAKLAFAGNSFAYGDVFAAKSITRALVPPRRDSDYITSKPPTTTLPEVIINRKSASTTTAAPQRDSQGYYYDPPNSEYLPPEQPFADEPQPPFADEYPTVDNQYLPPNSDPVFSDPPVNDYLPPSQQIPQQDEIIIVTTESGYIYNPPSSRPPLADEGSIISPGNDDGYQYNPPANGYLPPAGRSLRDETLTNDRYPIRLQLNELTCLQNSGGYFRSTLTIQSAIDGAPVIDGEQSGDLTGCNIRVQQTRLVVNIESSDFSRCGVVQCGNSARELCLRLRFPQIAGMRTAADAILTLQCKIQQRVVARTHAFRLGVSNNVQGRSTSGTYAFGGSQRPFRSQLGLFRRQDNGNGFTRSLEPGGAVILGEDLILRTQVRSGDGWNYTRLSEVVMQRLSPTASVLNSATLIATNGCVNPAMKAICPAAPILESPLSYRLAFRAAMFQGMRSGDEMVLRVRVVGCVERRECTVENCPALRSKRDTAVYTGPNSTVEHEFPSEVTTISFRIILPSNGTTIGLGPSLASPSVLTVWVTIATTAIIVVALTALLVIMKLNRAKQPCYDEYRAN